MRSSYFIYTRNQLFDSTRIVRYENLAYSFGLHQLPLNTHYYRGNHKYYHYESTALVAASNNVVHVADDTVVVHVATTAVVLVVAGTV